MFFSVLFCSIVLICSFLFDCFALYFRFFRLLWPINMQQSSLNTDMKILNVKRLYHSLNTPWVKRKKKSIICTVKFPNKSPSEQIVNWRGYQQLTHQACGTPPPENLPPNITLPDKFVTVEFATEWCRWFTTVDGGGRADGSPTSPLYGRRFEPSSRLLETFPPPQLLLCTDSPLHTVRVSVVLDFS